MKTWEAGRLVWKGIFGGVPEISVQDLKDYRREHGEGTYALLDVRQPGEYEKEHLPGALLIPLPQLESRLAELDADKPLIVYCAVGGRSRAAAEMLLGRGFKEVSSLAGGIKAWAGGVARGPQQSGLGLMRGDESPAGALAVAFGLEEGLRLFYEAAADITGEARAEELLRKLAGIEEKHKAVILEMFEAAGPGEGERRALEQATGQAVEGGRTRQGLMDQFGGGDWQTPDIIDWAMALETQAWDLYLRLAERARDAGAAQALARLGDEEKAHLESLARLREEAVN